MVEEDFGRAGKDLVILILSMCLHSHAPPPEYSDDLTSTFRPAIGNRVVQAVAGQSSRNPSSAIPRQSLLVAVPLWRAFHCLKSK